MSASPSYDTNVTLVGPLTRRFDGPIGIDGLPVLRTNLEEVHHFLWDAFAALRSESHDDTLRVTHQARTHKRMLTKHMKFFGGMIHSAKTILGETAFSVMSFSPLPTWTFLHDAFHGPVTLDTLYQFHSYLAAMRQEVAFRLERENAAIAAIAEGGSHIPRFDRRAVGQLQSYLEGAQLTCALTATSTTLDLAALELHRLTGSEQ